MSPGLNEVLSAAGLALSLLLVGCALDQGVRASEAPPTVTGPRAGAGTARAASATPLIARGNEPGWSLTMGHAEIELVTDYGAARSIFPKPAPEISGARRATWLRMPI
jgi:uncharacterized membrane protein